MTSQYGSAAELVASIRTLLTLPDVYLRVKEVVEDPDSYLEELVNAIAIDPGITARLLRVVNSAFLNLSVRVDDVRRAVNILGMQAVHDLVLATTVTRTFSGIDSRIMDMRAFWVQSVYRAVYARLVAGHCNVLDRERLFVEGLLSGIGHLVMYQQLPEQTEAALKRSTESGEDLSRVERDILGFHYAEVGGELMRAWQMPERLAESVRYHVEPGGAKEFPMGASIVHIACVLTRLHGGEINRELLSAEVDPAAWQITGLSPEELLQVHVEAMSEVDEVVGVMLDNGVAA